MVITTSSVFLCLCLGFVFFTRWRGVRFESVTNHLDRAVTALLIAFGIDLLVEAVLGTSTVPLIQAGGDVRIVAAFVIVVGLKVTLLLAGIWHVYHAVKQVLPARGFESVQREAAVHRAEAERARQEEEAAHAAQLAELERRAARMDCPACGQNFAYALARCSGCGLKFQAE